MNIVFISGVELGQFALNGLIDSDVFKSQEAKLIAVFSLSEEKAEKTSGYTSFDFLANQAKAPLFKISSIKTIDVYNQIKKLSPDFIFIIGWSELAPSELLDIPKNKYNSSKRHDNTHGCIGIHPTLLPIGRGRAPIPWTIIKGFTKSGVTMFYLEEEADAGDMIAQNEYMIEINDDASSIYKKIAILHYQLVKDSLPLLANRTAPRIPQDPTKVTYWEKRRPEDGVIDWYRESLDQYNWIRALTHPYPGAFTFWNGEKVIIWKAAMGEQVTNYEPGSIIDINDNGLLVACLTKSIIIKRLQLGDDEEMDSVSFSKKYGIKPGVKFNR